MVYASLRVKWNCFGAQINTGMRSANIGWRVFFFFISIRDCWQLALQSSLLLIGLTHLFHIKVVEDMKYLGMTNVQTKVSVRFGFECEWLVCSQNNLTHAKVAPLDLSP